MIYTVTFNPSLDYVINVKKFTKGDVNRSEKETIYPGGKGINVSIVLKNIGYDSILLGFTAGFTGNEIKRLVKDYGCKTDFIEIEKGFSRINVKIRHSEETDINCSGPLIEEKHIKLLFEKLNFLNKNDTLILAGSIPNTLPSDIYEKIMKHLSEKNINIIVDAEKQLLANCLKYKPFLVKPNNIELGEIFNTKIKTQEEAICYAKQMQKLGAVNVLVSMGESGAILIDEYEKTHIAKPPKGLLVNSVGAGDSMVAGFIAGFIETKDYEKAFRKSICAGSATAFSPWLATGEEISNLIKNWL